MPEFLQIDPKDLIEDPVIQDYSHSEGRGFGRYLVFLFFAGFFMLAAYARHGNFPAGEGETTVTANLPALVVFAALAIGLPAAIWIWKDFVSRHESGSKINTAQRQILWWDGPAPAAVQTIDVDEISRITFEPRGEEAEDIILWSAKDGHIRIPGQCVRHTRDWTKVLISHFPHIANGDGAKRAR